MSLSAGGQGAHLRHHLPTSSAAHVTTAGGTAAGFVGASLGAVPDQLLRDVITSTAGVGSRDMNGEFWWV